MTPTGQATSFDPTTGEITIDLDNGAAAVETRHDLRECPRPVVYLDQNHWIALAKSLVRPETLDAAALEACLAIVELARRRRIVLPLSSAHLIETGRRRGRSRYDVAATMLQLSRGWQMLSPLKVRRAELVAVLASYVGRASEPPESTDVFVLEPGALFAVPLGDANVARPPDVRAVHWAESLSHVLLDDEPVDEVRGPALAASWATTHHDLAQYQRSVDMPKEHKRINARARLLADLAREVAEAAAFAQLEQESLSQWVMAPAEQSLLTAPYVGRLHEVTHDRLSNADDRWEPNDLNDVHFLACAAAYADVVVAERKTSEYLRRAARRTPAGAFVCRKLGDAVAELARRGTSL